MPWRCVSYVPKKFFFFLKKRSGDINNMLFFCYYSKHVGWLVVNILLFLLILRLGILTHFFFLFDRVEWFVLIVLMFIYLWLAVCAVNLRCKQNIKRAVRLNIFAIILFVVIYLSYWECVDFVFHGLLLCDKVEHLKFQKQNNSKWISILR